VLNDANRQAPRLAIVAGEASEPSSCFSGERAEFHRGVAAALADLPRLDNPAVYYARLAHHWFYGQKHDRRGHSRRRRSATAHPKFGTDFWFS
jgi:hypothetical protein